MTTMSPSSFNFLILLSQREFPDHLKNAVLLARQNSQVQHSAVKNASQCS